MDSKKWIPGLIGIGQLYVWFIGMAFSLPWLDSSSTFRGFVGGVGLLLVSLSCFGMLMYASTMEREAERLRRYLSARATSGLQWGGAVQTSPPARNRSLSTTPPGTVGKTAPPTC